VLSIWCYCLLVQRPSFVLTKIIGKLADQKIIVKLDIDL
jgi:hypothetical protein